MENTIYAFWDAQQLQYILNSVAMMTSMDDYVGLMKVFAILGLFIAVTAGFVKARGEEAVYYVIILVIFYGALFLPKRDVVIQDMGTGTGTYTVANVPLGLAVFASAESHIGYWLTRASETVFAMPDDINFQKTGYMFASRAITERQKARFFKSSIFDSMLNFTKDCIYPEINNNPTLYEQTMTTGDLWTLWGTPEALNPGRLVSVYNPTSSSFEIMNCEAAYGVLDPQVNQTVSDDILPRIARKLNPTVDTVTASGLIASQLPLADDFILNASRTAAEGIRQAAMINMLSDSTVYVPQMNGDPAAAQVAIATATAAASANTAYVTMAKISESTLPVIRNAFHIIIIALFPIVMLIIVMAGSRGGLVFKTYLMALLWVNLWAPIYAVINFFMSWYTSGPAVAATTGMDTLSFGSQSGMIHSLISDQGIAGMLALSVPVIAYMLTNVSASSMTSVISGVMSPANSAAQSAGASAGLGNISAGNTSWGNVSQGNWSWNNISANKLDTVPTVNTAQPGMTVDSSIGVADNGRAIKTTSWIGSQAKQFEDLSTGDRFTMNPNLNTPLVSASMQGGSASLVAGAQRAREIANSNVFSSELSLNRAAQRATEDAAQLSNALTASRGRSNTIGINTGESSSISNSEGLSTSTTTGTGENNQSSVSAKSSDSQDKARQATISGDAKLSSLLNFFGKNNKGAGVEATEGGSFKSPINAGVKVTGSATDRTSFQEALDNSQSKDANIRKQGQQTLGQIRQAITDQLSISKGDSSETRALRALSSSISESIKASESYGVALNNREQVSKSSAETLSGSAGAQASSQTAAIKAIADHTGGQNLSGYMNAADLIRQSPDKVAELVYGAVPSSPESLSIAGDGPTRSQQDVNDVGEITLSKAANDNEMGVKSANPGYDKEARQFVGLSPASKPDTKKASDEIKNDASNIDENMRSANRDTALQNAANQYASYQLAQQAKDIGTNYDKTDLNQLFKQHREQFLRAAADDPNLANNALTFVTEHQKGNVQPQDGDGKQYIPQVKMEGRDGLAEQVRFNTVKRGEEPVEPKIIRLN